MNFNKLKDGHIYSEYFKNNNLVWQVFPDDKSRYSILNKMQLKAGDGKIFALTNCPSGNFVMQCRIKHDMLSKKSFANVVAMKDNNNFIECQTYFDSNKIEPTKYQYIKMARVNNIFYFYAMSNGRWEIVGSEELKDVGIVGFSFESDLYGESIEIYDVEFYSSNIIKFQGCIGAKVIELINNNDEVITRSDIINKESMIDSTEYIMPMRNCKIKYILEDDTSIIDNVETLNGGDVFKKTIDIIVKVNDKPIANNGEFNLGNINNSSEYTITVTNNDSNKLTLFGASMSVEQYGAFNVGHTNVYLKAKADDVYDKQISLPTLKFGESTDIYMRIERCIDEEFLFKANDLRYTIIIE